MSLENFYGGKQGLSSIIKKAFRYISVDDPAYIAQQQRGETPSAEQVMELCFQNPAYKEVWYGELCIINTFNKNNPANGCLFRRTLSGQGSQFPIEIYRNAETTNIGSNNTKLSAEYIGQIVGPQSGTPYIKLGNLDSVDEKAKEALSAYDQKVYEYDLDGDENPELIYDEALAADKHVFIHDARAENLLIPGKNSGDEIKYSWCNIRKNDHGEDSESWTYLGFQIPYLEIDWVINQVNYYEEYKVKNEQPDRIFYQDWHINIPRGVRGNAASRIRRTTLRNENNSVYWDFSEVIKQRMENSNVTSDYYINTSASKLNEETISLYFPETIRDSNWDYRDVPFFVYDYTIYNSADAKYIEDKQEDGLGKTVSIFMGFDKDIDSFTLSEDGKITAHYTDKTKKLIGGDSIKWISSVSINAPLAEINPGLFTINYNTGETWSHNLGLVNEGIYNPETGRITLKLTNGTSFDIKGQFEYPVRMDLLGDISDDGSDADDSRQISYTTNLGNSSSIGDEINYIQDIVVTKDMHLCILFNSETARSPKWTVGVPGDESHAGDPDVNGLYWRKGLKGSKVVDGEPVIYGGEVYWRDYGSIIKYSDKLYVGHALELEKNPNGGYDYELVLDDETEIVNVRTKEDIINNILQQKWPEGLQLEDIGNNETLDMRGMLVSGVMVDEATNIEITYFFVYDYERNPETGTGTWKCIQESSSSNTIDLQIDDQDLEYIFRLKTEGVILNTSEWGEQETTLGLPTPWLPEGTRIFVDEDMKEYALTWDQGTDMINDIWEDFGNPYLTPIQGADMADDVWAENMVDYIWTIPSNGD